MANGSFYLKSTSYGPFNQGITDNLKPVNGSFYACSFDYGYVPVLLISTLVGSVGLSGNITPTTALGVALSGTISVAGNITINSAILLGAALSGTLNVTGDITPVVSSWDYDAEYLLIFH